MSIISTIKHCIYCKANDNQRNLNDQLLSHYITCHPITQLNLQQNNDQS